VKQASPHFVINWFVGHEEGKIVENQFSGPGIWVGDGTTRRKFPREDDDFSIGTSSFGHLQRCLYQLEV
jgi:hypothetical protein